MNPMNCKTYSLCIVFPKYLTILLRLKFEKFNSVLNPTYSEIVIVKLKTHAKSVLIVYLDVQTLN